MLDALQPGSLQRVDDLLRQPITLGYYFMSLAAQGYPADLSTDALVMGTDLGPDLGKVGCAGGVTVGVLAKTGPAGDEWGL